MVDKNIKISVIIPAYNMEEQLGRCLQSVLAQTYENLEIIVINDGSTDGTAMILDRFAEQDTRILPVHQDNRGLVMVREKGIAMASGSYIGFVDGDDAIEQDMYERLLKNALHYQADISCCGMLYCFYDGRRQVSSFGKERELYDQHEGLRKLLRGEIEPSLCNKLYRADILADSCLNTQLINNEDLLRNYVLFSRSEKIVTDTFCGYQYWRRENSMSNNSCKAGIIRDRLGVREEIRKAAIPDVEKEIGICYITGLINAYSALRDSREEGDRALREECRQNIRKNLFMISGLDIQRKLYALAVIFAPWLADAAGRLHRKRLYAEIRKQKRNLKQ